MQLPQLFAPHTSVELTQLYEASIKINNYGRIASSTAIKKMPLMVIPCQLNFFYCDKCPAGQCIIPSTSTRVNGRKNRAVLDFCCVDARRRTL